MSTVTRIVSGGQTGADRGGLRAADALHLAHGGWCPKGRRAEDGLIPQRWVLKETASTDYHERTRLNVRDSDGTLLFTETARLTPGSRTTLRAIIELGRQYHHANLSLKRETLLRDIARWLADCKAFGTPVVTLNVAGTRESKAPGIEQHVCQLLVTALRDSSLPLFIR